ncbi:hypothetical protein NEIG_01603 [Nematocida sp. ERTm5]|nr:hypothetical protein NEIG_01603 [Nematocida sp. ERTm5]
MYLHRKNAPIHASVEVSEIIHNEKITCVSPDRELYGGFMGGIYRTNVDTPKAVFRIDSPVSFIAKVRASDQFREKDTPCIESNEHKIEKVFSPEKKCVSLEGYAIGDWEGRVYFLGKKIQIPSGSCPIKYIFPTDFGLVICTQAEMYLFKNGTFASSIYINTYPLHISCTGRTLIVVTGYSVQHIQIGEHGLVREEMTELLRNENHTETITCISENNPAIAGSIGGWIMELDGWGEGKPYCLRKIHRVSQEKLIGIVRYVHENELFYICGTPKSVYIINEKSKTVVYSVNLTDASGIFSIQLKHGNKHMLSVFDRNFKVHTIDMSCVFLPENSKGVANKDPINTTINTYEELLKELNSGVFD